MPVDVQYGGGILGNGAGESEAYAPAISVETVFRCGDKKRNKNVFLDRDGQKKSLL